MPTFPALAVACSALTASLVTSLPTRPSTHEPVAHTPFGPVRGFTANGTDAFRGIPYAQPPFGDLRFRPPKPPTSWTAVRDGSNFGPSCIQMGAPQLGGYSNRKAWNSINVTHASEDCLTLNVYTPHERISASPLAVMVYLHAGEFRFGSSNDIESNWPYFANGTVVLVTVNSRLGLLGFGALDSLRDRDPERSTGNYGMQDQRAALEWVHKSISAFGGDATRITIFGESSGGTSVAFHLLSARSHGLFHRAILESPGLTQSKPWSDAVTNTHFATSGLTAAASQGCVWPSTATWMSFNGLMARGQPLGVALSINAAKAKCAANAKCYMIVAHSGGMVTLYGSGIAGQISQSPVVVFNVSASGEHPTMHFEMILRVPDEATAEACLVKAAVGDLIGLMTSPPYTDTFETDAVAPTIDGVELKVPLQQLVRSEPAYPSAIDVLAGSNLDEGTEFMELTPALACNASRAELAAWAIRQFGPELGAKVPAEYSDVELPAPVCKKHHYGPQPSPATPTSRSWVAAMRSAGDSAILCRSRELLRNVANKGGRAFWYYFKATPINTVNFPVDELKNLGAFHGAEVPFVFGDNFELSSKGERRLSQAMGCYWATFAASGDPNSKAACSTALGLPHWPVIGAADEALTLSNATISSMGQLKTKQCNLFLQYP